ncbi:MAG: toxin-antitoxin system, antitoxin component, Xre family protein [Clostridia bacterium]|nr:toxin-antitoxin system, antitoxin component, Xre family protein [Clostridia bacterium]
MTTNKSLLDEHISKSGLKITFIAEQLGITVQSFGQKRNNITSFKAAEIYVLCDLLNITDDKDKIFLP